MAINIGNASNSGVVAAISSITFSHNHGGGINGALVVGIQSRDAGSSSQFDVTGVTFNGVALTVVGTPQEFPSDAFLRVELWRLANPTATTANIVVTYTGAVDHASAGGQSLSNVDQANMVNTSAGAQNTSGSATDSSVNLTTTIPGCLIIDSVYNKTGSNMTVGANQTQIFQLSPNGGGDRSGMSYETTTTAGSKTMSWTVSPDDDWAIFAAAFTPAGEVQDIIDAESGVMAYPRV